VQSQFSYRSIPVLLGFTIFVSLMFFYSRNFSSSLMAFFLPQSFKMYQSKSIINFSFLIIVETKERIMKIILKY